MDVIMRNELANVKLTALTAATETPIAFDQKDDQAVLVLNNTGSSPATVTIKAGNGIQGVNDEVLTVPAGINLIKLESGRFKFVTGDNKGKIVLKAAASGVQYGIVALI